MLPVAVFPKSRFPDEGRAEGRIEIVQAMFAKGMDIDTISELTGLSVDEIRALQ